MGIKIFLDCMIFYSVRAGQIVMKNGKKKVEFYNLQSKSKFEDKFYTGGFK